MHNNAYNQNVSEMSLTRAFCVFDHMSVIYGPTAKTRLKTTLDTLVVRQKFYPFTIYI